MFNNSTSKFQPNHLPSEVLIGIFFDSKGLDGLLGNCEFKDRNQSIFTVVELHFAFKRCYICYPSSVFVVCFLVFFIEEVGRILHIFVISPIFLAAVANGHGDVILLQDLIRISTAFFAPE